MKLTTAVLAVAILTAAAGAQNPGVIDNMRSTMHALRQKQSGDGNTVLALNSPQSTKPAAGAPAPAVKPVAIPGANTSVIQAKPAAVPVSSRNNELQAVDFKHSGNDIQIEIKSREAVTPKVSKLSSPARVLVELPSTVMKTAQSKVAVDSNGVKGVRIGMDGKTPPTTSVVVDLDQQCAYELSAGPGNSFVLTLHTQQTAAAKNTPAAPAKTTTAKATAAAPAPTAAKNAAAKAPAVVPVPAQSAQKSVPVPTAQPVKQSAAASAMAKLHDAFMPKPAATPGVTAKVMAPEKIVAKPSGPPATTKAAANDKPSNPGDAAKPAAPAMTKIAAEPKPSEPAKTAEAPKPKPEEKKWAMNGKRDPFFSPVVEQPSGSGCSTGKKCLDVGEINLRGVVRSDTGFIAVVTNSANKAYFLHENDPVFDGYVMKITGDSVVFQQTVQDKLGKPFTKEVVKRIVTPAV
jgi:hypothetical protein